MVMRRPGRTAKVTPQEVLAIREDYATGQYSQPDLARKYGIGPGQVGKIVRGEAWMNLTAGNPVLTDSDAQLRQLTTPQPSQEEIAASLAKVQRLLGMDVSDGGDAAGSDSVAPPNAPAPAQQLPPLPLPQLSESANERLQGYLSPRSPQELIDSIPPEQLQRARAAALERETKTKMKAETAQPALKAEQLLETLKDENQPG